MRSWPFLMALLLVPAAVMAAEPTSSSPTASFKVLEAAHAEPGSMFMEVDGLRVHYVDEGLREAGAPAVLMLNASYTNLSSWRGVAERLRGGHRVIRLDFPTVGLSGGPGGPAADAMLDIRAFEGLVLGVMDRLGVTQVTLVGTSSGAIVAFRLAAAHPERVTRLVLLNAAGLPRTAATDPLRARVRAADAPPVGSLGFWRESLEANFSQASRVSDDLVRYVYDMNRRAEQDREGRVFMKTFATGDPQGVLGRITMPTLILWGKKGVTLSHLEAEVFQGWLTRAPVMIRKYEDAGHYPQMEQPGAVAGDIAAFVAGEMDARLRPAPGVMAATLAEVPFWQANAGLWLGEDVYMTGAGEPKIKGYANLTETRLEAAAMEEEEYRFYPPSEMATAMAGGLLRAGEGVEVRRLLKGQMADAGAGYAVAGI